MDDRFDWTPTNRAEMVKRGLRRSDVEQAVLDKRKPRSSDLPPVDGEVRFQVVGKSRAGQLLTVVYTIRRRKYHVITARPAADPDSEHYLRGRL